MSINQEESNKKFAQIIRTLQFHGFTLESQAAGTLLNYFEEYFNLNNGIVDVNEFLKPYLDEFYRVLPSLSIITNPILTQIYNIIRKNMN